MLVHNDIIPEFDLSTICLMPTSYDCSLTIVGVREVPDLLLAKQGALLSDRL